MPPETPVEATRLNDGKPVLTADHFRKVGASEAEAGNINGPSVVRVPDWVPVHERPAKDARYYLYFAHHGGRYIRMAYAPEPTGPWRPFNTGDAVDSSMGDESSASPPRRTPGSGVLDLDLADSGEISTGSFRIRRHIASPDVLIDSQNRRFVMYFHAPSSTGRQETFVATSQFGLNFNPAASGGEEPAGAGSGVRDVIPGWFYFRTFEVAGRTFAYANGGRLYRAPGTTAAGERATLENADEPGGLWNPAGEEDRAEYWELIADRDNPIREIYRKLDRKTDAPRHFAVHHDEEAFPDDIFIFYTAKGDAPERILLTVIDLSALSRRERQEPANWRVKPPDQRTLLEPDQPWEGGDLPVATSASGKAVAVRELRDPFIFKDADGQLYLFYTGRGEEAIGVAALKIRSP